jgi:hypothetical protein
MKLVLKEYLASLGERDQLDVILPDLLSQMGLNVFSRPGRGARQDGVDVGAVGSLPGEPEKVYLVSIKPGDLTRRTWDSESVQSLRPSLNEIRDSYIPNRLPSEHKDKDIVICICVGGDVQEQVRPALEGFIKQNTTERISYVQWNGDRLAAFIEESFLREDLVPVEVRSRLRKSLAMLDQPEVSYKHFAILIRSLGKIDGFNDAQIVLAARQIALCLWILFSWARKEGNMEAAYTAGELSLLYAWRLARGYEGTSTKMAEAVVSAFNSTFSAYEQISSEYLSTTIMPYVDKLHGLSSAVRAPDSLDVNLKLFDILGRLGLRGLWHYWQSTQFPADQIQLKQEQLDSADQYALAILQAIANNPALMSPIKDDQAIDIALALFLLRLKLDNSEDMKAWLEETFNRCAFAYISHGHYPCILRSYVDLLDHPKPHDVEYRKEVTVASILYPAMAFWAAMHGFDVLYAQIGKFQKEDLGHCNFQMWYPDENSEEHLYTNSAPHGGVLTDLIVGQPKADFLNRLFMEVEVSSHFSALSAVKSGMWPLILVACRHHRLPIPVNFFPRPKDPEGGAAESPK